MAGTIRGRQEEDRDDSERDRGGGDERVEGIVQVQSVKERKEAGRMGSIVPRASGADYCLVVVTEKG
jgi:hypothetical protein